MSQALSHGPELVKAWLGEGLEVEAIWQGHAVGVNFEPVHDGDQIHILPLVLAFLYLLATLFWTGGKLQAPLLLPVVVPAAFMFAFMLASKKMRPRHLNTYLIASDGLHILMGRGKPNPIAKLFGHTHHPWAKLKVVKLQREGAPSIFWVGTGGPTVNALQLGEEGPKVVAKLLGGQDAGAFRPDGPEPGEKDTYWGPWAPKVLGMEAFWDGLKAKLATQEA